MKNIEKDRSNIRQCDWRYHGDDEVDEVDDEAADQVRCLETDTTFLLNSFQIVLTVGIQFTHHHHNHHDHHHHDCTNYEDDADHHMKSVQWPQKTG